MSSLQPRSPYSRYSPLSHQSNEAVPLRSKIFSQLDNITQNQSRAYPKQSVPARQNVDRIAEIKKKYQKLLNKSVSKPSETAENIVVEYNRSTSRGMEYKVSNLKKGEGVFLEGEKIQSKINENMYTPIKRQSSTIQYSGSKKGEIKSQLQSNRSALTAMKSQLQAKLNELSTKTIMSSALHKSNEQENSLGAGKDQSNYGRSPISKPSYNGNSALTSQESRSYQKIIQKYSKLSSKNGREAALPREVEVKESKRVKAQEKDHSRHSYSKKYGHNGSSNADKGKILKPQLSVISEKSNSNNSGSFTHLDIEGHESKAGVIESSNVREIVDSNMDELFKKRYQESTRVVEQEKDSRYLQRKWMRNACSYLEEKQSCADAGYQAVQSNNSENKHEKEFILNKLQSNVGPIKRTTTQENFSHFKKPLQSYNAVQQKQSSNKNVGQVRKCEVQGSSLMQFGSELTEATFGKKMEKESFKVYEATPVPSHQKSIIVSNEIQKFKEKYGKANPESSTSISENAGPEVEKRSVWKNYQFKDNKDISSKIDKIDQRIKEIENNKKNLNIAFKPYEAKSIPKYTNQATPTKAPLPETYAEKSNAKYFAVGHVPQQSIKQEYTTYNRPRVASYMERVKPMYSESTLPDAVKTAYGGFAIKLLPVEASSEDTVDKERSVSGVSSKESKKKEYLNKLQIELRTDSGIQERKKKLQDKVQMASNIKFLVKLFGQQAVFDEVFRNNKIWFASENKEGKWTELRSQLKSNGVDMSEKVMREEFELLQSQNNPFFSVSDSKCDVKTLVRSYLQAQRHWQQKLSKKFVCQNLEKQGFIVSKLDLDKKGYILIEDFVRFLNIESGNFLRNRDVSIIFRRINGGSEKVRFEDIVGAVCQ